MRIPDGISYYLLAIIWLNEDAYTLYSYEKSRQLSHELICPHSSRSATPVYETTD